MFKKFLEKKGISADQFKEMDAEKQMDLQNEYLGELESQIGKSASKEEMETTIKDEIKKLSNGAIKEIADDIAAMQETLKTGFSNETLQEAVIKAITDKHEDIKNAYKSGSGVVEIVVKAPAIITTANGTSTGQPGTYPVEITGLDNVNLRRYDITNYVTTRPTSMASYAYTEALPKDGDFDIVAEGAVKPQIDLTWETRYASPYKIAAWEKLTEESVYDIKGLEGVARDYLKKKHDIKKSKLIL